MWKEEAYTRKDTVSNCPVHEMEQSRIKRGLLVFLPITPGPGDIALSRTMPDVVAGETSAVKEGEAAE